MYVYTETGKLVDRVLYQDIADRCGKPESISEDGQKIVFRVSDRTKELYVVQIHIDKLEIIRKIDIVQSIKQYIHEYKRIDVNKHNKMLKFWNDYLLDGKDLIKIRFSYCLNDAADLLVRIRLTSELVRIKQKQLQDLEGLLEDSENNNEIENIEEMVQYSFFYYTAG